MKNLEKKVNAIFSPLKLSVYVTDDEIEFSGCGVRFRLSNKKMYIDSLARCEPYSGTDLLEHIIAFAKDQKVTCIELHDVSSTNWCDFETSLAHLEILASGISWYNRFGFKSAHHDRDVKKNARLREQWFDQTIDPFLLDEFNRNFPDIATDRQVKDVIQDIKRLGRDLEKKQCETIKKIFAFFYFEIQYNKKLTRKGGKKHRTMKSRSSRLNSNN